MPNKKHHIKLTPEERKELGAVARKRNAAATSVQRAKVILAVDIGPGGPGLTDLEASLGSGLTTRSIQRLRARACEVGPLGALERKPRDQPLIAANTSEGNADPRLVKWQLTIADARIKPHKLYPTV